MLRHLVLVRFRPEAPADTARRAVEALAALPALIPELRACHPALDVGADPDNCPLALVADFDDGAALQRYLEHPAHARVVDEFLAPWLLDLAVSDVEM